MKSELLPIDKKYRIEIDIQSEMGTRTRPVMVAGIDRYKICTSPTTKKP